MSAISKTIKNIPPRARVMMSLTFIIGLIALYMFYTILSGKEANVAQSLAEVEISMSGSDNISQLGDSENEVFQSDEVDSIFETARDDKIERVKETSDISYIDQIRLENKEDKLKELNGDLKLEDTREQINANMGIESKLQTMRERERINRQKAELVNDNTVQATQQADVVIPLFDSTAFLTNELKMASGNTKFIVNDALYNKVSVSSVTYRSTEQMNKNGWNSSNQNLGEAVPIQERLTDKSRFDNYLVDGKKQRINELDQLRTSNGGSVSNSDINNYSELANPLGQKTEASTTTINAGTIFYGISQIGINTDEISPTKAFIVEEGPLKNAPLLGMPTRVGEKAVVTYNTIVVNKVTYTVEAIALDLETLRTGIADNVDRHIFERYGKLISAAMISGYADALTGIRTVKNDDGSTEEIIDKLPNTEDQLAYAIGRAGETLIPVFEEGFNRPPTVDVNPNREIGIMLMSDLVINNQ
ncbi:DotG/IcmE/VirB10 family protein [Vibrio splendidus]